MSSLPRRAAGFGLVFSLLISLALLIPTSSQGIDESEILYLHVLFTSDIHGYVAPFDATWMNPDFPPPMGGGASAATYVKKVRERIQADPNAAMLLIDAGDCWQGSPVGTLTEGKVMVDFYNALDYDFIAVGNHEFDAGWERVRAMSGELAQPMVSCNILNAETGELVDWVVPYRVFERHGLRIGLIGAITPGTEQMAFKDNIAGLEFAPLAPTVEHYREILRTQEEVDLVMLVVHDGLPHPSQLDSEWERVLDREREGEDLYRTADGALELAHVIRGVPVMFGGDTHQGYQEPWIDPYSHVMFFEPYAKGTAVGHAILKIHRETGEVLGHEPIRRDGALITTFEDQYWPDPEMQEVLRPWIEEVEVGLKEVVGRSEVELIRAGRSNSVMGNFVTECMRAAFDADLAFSNVGGLRTDLGRGPITMGEIQELLPFGNSLAVVEMDGRMVRRIFERKAGSRSSGIYFSGATIAVDPSAPEGERLLECDIAGGPLRPDQIYRVVTSDYLLDGNSGFDFLTGLPAERVTYTQFLTRDAVIQYLQQNSPVSPRVDGRFREERGGEMASHLRDWARSDS
jgi:2',3'-cyclic-nucleotide 2'-phosphodiesterase (5'-nucleotidase family)